MHGIMDGEFLDKEPTTGNFTLYYGFEFLSIGMSGSKVEFGGQM
jgi:hypothetical protein